MWTRCPAAVLVCVCAMPVGATVRVLARPGDRATDGTSLGGWSGPVSVRGRLLARSATQALVRVTGDVRAVLARTGDPLPTPLSGRFERLGAADVIATGSVVFAAKLPAPDAPSGLFEAGDAGVRVLAQDIGSPRELAANPAGDVLAASRGSLVLWRRADATVATLVDRRLPDGMRVRDIYPGPALSDDGTVAFAARIRPLGGRSRDEVTRVYRRAPDGALVVLTETLLRLRGPTLSRRTMGANSLGDVVQMLGLRSAEGVFLHPADGGQPVRVAGPGDAVGDRVLREVQPGLVAVDDRRRVAFLARLDDGLHVLLADAAGLRSLAGPLPDTSIVGGARLPDSASAVWTANGALFRAADGGAPVLGLSVDTPQGPGFVVGGTPAVGRAGAVVAQVERGGLYELAQDGAHPVLRQGDTVDGRRVTGLLAYSATSAGDLVALATLDDGRTALLLKSGEAGWARMASDGDPNDRGDTISLTEPLDYDARHGSMVAALSLTDPSRTLLHALRPGLPPELLFIVTPERTLFDEVGEPVLLRDRLLFWGQRPGAESGAIFQRRGNTVREVISPGTPVRGGRLGAIMLLRAADGGLLFESSLSETTTSLFAWRPGGRLRRLDRPGWPALAALVGGPRRFATIGARRESDARTLYLITPGGVRRLAVAGEPSPLGGSLTLVAFEGDGETGPSIALSRRGVAFQEGAAVLEAGWTARSSPTASASP